jgi:hypothetical protein
MSREHLESLQFSKKCMCLHCGLSPAAQIFHSVIYTILIKGQTCEKLGRPHCGFFPAAQIFHSDIFTTLKVPKREIFDRSDFPDFHTMKSLRMGDFGVKIKKCLKNI